MKKAIFIFVVSILVLTTILSGCTDDKKAVEKEKAVDISFSSDVLELLDSNVEVREENGKIYFVEVTLYFKSLIDKTANFDYRVDFCDKYDNVLHSRPYSLLNIPANYNIASPDVFSYDGEDTEHFDHVNVYVENYEIKS